MYGVILADDDPWALAGLAGILNWEDHGFKILARCCGGAEALEALKRQGADLLFTDLRMPGMDGAELIAQVKAASPGTECVISSAYSDFEAARKALSCRAAGYVLKPLHRSEIIDLLKSIKAALDKKPGEAVPIDLSDRRSIEDAIRRLTEAGPGPETGVRYRVLLSPRPLEPEKTPPGGIADITIAGSGLFCRLYRADDKQPPPRETAAPKTAPDAGSYPHSRWHHSRQKLPAMLYEAAASGAGNFSYADHPLVSAVQLYIGTHFDMDISVKALAAQFFVSPDYLSELFKRHTERPLIGFTVDVRLYHACRLLEHTGLSLKEIARRAGFNDPGYFGRRFKRFTGRTPEQFRLRCQNTAEPFRPNYWLDSAP